MSYPPYGGYPPAMPGMPYGAPAAMPGLQLQQIPEHFMIPNVPHRPPFEITGFSLPDAVQYARAITGFCIHEIQRLRNANLGRQIFYFELSAGGFRNPQFEVFVSMVGDYFSYLMATQQGMAPNQAAEIAARELATLQTAMITMDRPGIMQSLAPDIQRDVQAKFGAYQNLKNTIGMFLQQAQRAGMGQPGMGGMPMGGQMPMGVPMNGNGYQNPIPNYGTQQFPYPNQGNYPGAGYPSQGNYDPRMMPTPGGQPAYATGQRMQQSGMGNMSVPLHNTGGGEVSGRQQMMSPILGERIDSEPKHEGGSKEGA